MLQSTHSVASSIFLTAFVAWYLLVLTAESSSNGRSALINSHQVFTICEGLESLTSYFYRVKYNFVNDKIEGSSSVVSQFYGVARSSAEMPDHGDLEFMMI